LGGFGLAADIDRPGDFVRGRVDRRRDRGPALENEDPAEEGII
jgi:hypothetical protein